MKCKRTIILIVVALICLCMLPTAASASNLLTYTVTTDVTSGGSVYYNYNKNGAFFLKDDWASYTSRCKINSKEKVKFTKLLDRGFIVQPKSGYYFSGFYTNNGKKVYLSETEMDILRVSVNGIYFYDYYPAHSSAGYSRYSKTGYQNLVKSYLKGIYGTSRYKVMDTVTLYKIPKKDGFYVAQFKKKSIPKVSIPKSVTKTYGNNNFRLLSSLPANLACSFKSSNSSVVTISQKTGYVTIKGPGSSKITCNISATEKTLPASFTTKITIKPAKPSIVSAKRSKKSLAVSWKSDSKNSGYEIQVSNNKSFSTILAKKTITSGKTKNTTVKLKTDLFNNYVRIRSYKISNGERIYSTYSISKITT